MKGIYNAKRIKAVKLADAINLIEGVPVTEYAKKLSIQWAHGEITGEAMVVALVTKHRRPIEAQCHE